ncbi:MAG: hypothetical protein MI746_06580 [Pseudomonadales bacterium]|nr:hypothetical protein [Pseudomonadales bacterium]
MQPSDTAIHYIRIFISRLAGVLSLACLPLLAQAQGTPLAVELLPLGKDLGIQSGQTVTPAFEGWYENEAGDIELSFGFYNRNSEEVLDIPVGAANRIIGAADGNDDQGQPTVFATGRHWGVFTVTIPADHEDEVVWHLENQGKVFHVPANLHTDYVIDAIVGDANGNLPPKIRFSEDGPTGHGPAGITAGPVNARVGEPVSLDAWVTDDGKVSGIAAMFVAQSGATPPVDLHWFAHQGPGTVEFSEVETKIPAAGGQATTEATFSEAGSYLVRARITDLSGPEIAGHSQCCWTNSFIRVDVSN